MKVPVLCLMVMLFLAPVSLAAYDYCKDLPNVYTVEDLKAIEEKCKDAPVLASKIYPSATWIIHGYVSEDYDLYSNWITADEEENKKTLRKICIIWLGGKGSAPAYDQYRSVSGNCGGSYPIDYADEFNFIDFTSFIHDSYPSSFKHSLIQDEQEVLNNDHYILIVQNSYVRDFFTGHQQNAQTLLAGADLNNKYVKNTFNNNPKLATQTNQCPGWGITNSGQLEKCGSILGPLVYNSSFYGMEKLDINDRPYHHGCFTVENVTETTLDFLGKLKTGSDYVDRCIGKFANVVRNNTNLCPDPRRYYASMDPDPESLIRMAFLNSKWNKQGVPEVKVEFPEGMTYECVNECSGTIDDNNATVDPVGQYEFPCKIFTGDVTLMKDTLKAIPPPGSARTLEHIREIKGRLTVNAEVDSDVLPQLRIVGGKDVEAPSLVLTITDKNIYEAVLPMRLTTVTAKSGSKKPVLLRHSMLKEEIPKTLKDDLERSAGGEDSIKYEKIELHSHKRNHFV